MLIPGLLLSISLGHVSIATSYRRNTKLFELQARRLDQSDSNRVVSSSGVRKLPGSACNNMKQMCDNQGDCDSQAMPRSALAEALVTARRHDGCGGCVRAEAALRAQHRSRSGRGGGNRALLQWLQARTSRGGEPDDSGIW